MTQAQNAQFVEDHSIQESAGAGRFHPMAPRQEVPHASTDMIVDRSISLVASPVAEVRRPSSQLLVQAVAHFFPGPHITGPQEVSHVLLDSLHALLRRAGSQIPVTIFPITMRPERISEKVKPLLARLLDAGLAPPPHDRG